MITRRDSRLCVRLACDSYADSRFDRLAGEARDSLAGIASPTQISVGSICSIGPSKIKLITTSDVLDACH